MSNTTRAQVFHLDRTCSVKRGAGLWIGALIPPSIGPCSSTGSPITFKIRPRVPWERDRCLTNELYSILSCLPGPTGTMMGAPVSTTSCPRTRPSVASMEIVRTVFSPRCWATSRTRRGAPGATFTSKAFKIGGRAPSNCMYVMCIQPKVLKNFAIYY